MLELIFRGGLEWGYGLILECWEYFSVILMDIMSMDFAYLREHMPVLNSIQQIVLTIGWAILLGNLVFQAAKTMLTGLGFEGEDPKLLFVRTFIFAFLLLASPQICELCLNMTSKMIDLMQVPDAVDITFADEASFGGMAAAWLLVIICGIIVMFQSFKLIFEMAERYFILAVLTILAPVAFGVGGSRNTSDIFAGWCRMYGSMCLLMILNVMFIKMLLSVLSFYPSGVDVLPWMVLVLTIVKVAKKIDGIITRIGLNPAITGDPLGRTFPGALTCLVMKTAAAQVSKTIGRPPEDPAAAGRPIRRPAVPEAPGPVVPGAADGPILVRQPEAPIPTPALTARSRVLRRRHKRTRSPHRGILRRVSQRIPPRLRPPRRIPYLRRALLVQTAGTACQGRMSTPSRKAGKARFRPARGVLPAM